MDAVGLSILAAELDRDIGIVRDAAGKARRRVAALIDGALESIAYELARLYNVLEKMLERVCLAFENRLERRGDYPERLLQRLALPLPGLRPAFLPIEALPTVRELKGFRHRVRHAYDLTLSGPRIGELVALASGVAAALPEWCAVFVRAVRIEQGWT